MILQTVIGEKFAGVSRVVVPLKKPSQAGTLLALAVCVDGGVALRVADGAGAGRWRCTCDGRTSMWVRSADAQGGVCEVVIETVGGQTISGYVMAVESAGAAPNVALQRLADLLAGAP